MSNDVFSPDWLGERRRRLACLDLGPDTSVVGQVERVADGIARVSGLPDTALGSLLRFDDEKFGFVQSLDRDLIDVVLLDEASGIEAGDQARDTGEVLRAPVGEALLGRIVDPLGRPLDGGPAPKAQDLHPIERPAPSIIERGQVAEPVESGLLVIDSLFAIGRGQRELIIGDRSTGKTSLAADIMINQKNSDLICVYVAIGQRATAVERVIAAVREHGNLERCIFVVAGAATAPGLQWIAPFAGQTMAEYFRDKGQHALIVFDDLTRHAATHRELALLTHEPPGREAYPGDIFYLHARLLERAAKLGDDHGGGSITALPIAETDAGNLAAYIPTNLISITDGQIFLNSHLFAANQLPAVDVGLSVSRVGGKAQKAALRVVSRRVRLDYAQFLEIELFTRLGGISNPRVSRQIAHGKRIRSLLSQPRFSGLRLCDQVALLAALEEGALDEVPVEHIPELRQRLPAWIDQHLAREISALCEGGILSSGLRQSLVASVSELARLLAAPRDAIT